MSEPLWTSMFTQLICQNLSKSRIQRICYRVVSIQLELDSPLLVFISLAFGTPSHLVNWNEMQAYTFINVIFLHSILKTGSLTKGFREGCMHLSQGRNFWVLLNWNQSMALKDSSGFICSFFISSHYKSYIDEPWTEF